MDTEKRQNFANRLLDQRSDMLGQRRRTGDPGIRKGDAKHMVDSGSGSGTETIDAVKEGKTMTPAHE